MTVALRILGSVLSLFGAAGVLVSVLALVDPVGTKLADDGDPFGTPPPASESWTMLGAYAFVFVGGVWLLIRRKKPAA